MHSKTVERATVSLYLEFALLKPCTRMAEDSFNNQTVRLQMAGFSCSVICEVAETLLLKRKRKADTRLGTKRPQVVPDMHQVAGTQPEEG